MTITLTLDELFTMLAQAAQEGIRVGKANTDGDHTASGIAFYAYRDHVDAQDARKKAEPEAALRQQFGGHAVRWPLPLDDQQPEAMDAVTRRAVDDVLAAGLEWLHGDNFGPPFELDSPCEADKRLYQAFQVFEQSGKDTE